MKKISFFVAIAAAASLASCTAQAPKANMKNDVDSLSYMMGITNTQGLDMYMSQQLGVDTTYMADFIRGVKEGTSKTSPKDVAYMAGLQIGQQVGGRMFDMMSQRIFGNDSTQSLSKENFLAGFMAALQKKGMNVTMEEANAYVQSKAEAIKTLRQKHYSQYDYYQNIFFTNQNSSPISSIRQDITGIDITTIAPFAKSSICDAIAL